VNYNGLNNDALIPNSIIGLVQLPYQKNVYLCPQTQIRWKYKDGILERDSEGEEDWKKMAEYVGKTYSNVFVDSYNYALENR